MKTIAIPLICLFLTACSNANEDREIETVERTDPIIGQWAEVLDQGSPYDQVIWTFSSNGMLELDFDGTRLNDGRWSAVSNGASSRYSMDFQQYPDAAKRPFFLNVRFSSENTVLTIEGESTLNHWVGNRQMVRQE
ncbi:MAG: hypothetical protein ACPG8F_02990 [Flavobacteriaceae bacterium]